LRTLGAFLIFPFPSGIAYFEGEPLIIGITEKIFVPFEELACFCVWVDFPVLPVLLAVSCD
jgi:hypothetical protein